MNFYRIALTAVGAAVGMSSVAHAQSTDWASRININGDLRYRLERDLNAAGSAAPAAGTTDNYYQRIRARLGVNAKVNDSLMANFRLSTSLSGNTSNQTLGQTSPGSTSPVGTKKFFGLDLAYFDYKIVEGVNAQAGKMPNLFWTPGKTEMVWNSSMSHEGVQAKWWGEYGSLKPFATLTYSVIADRVNTTPAATSNTNGPDIMMLGGQAGLAWKSDPMWATVAVGSYNYNNTTGFGTFSATQAGTSTQFGNSVSGTGTAATYAAEYKILNVGAEVGYNLGFAPLSAFFDYATNSGDVTFATGSTGPTDQKTGMLAGLKLGALTAPGSWFVGYNYRNVQRDAVFGYSGESAAIGGGTDVLGSQYQVGYQAWANAAIGLTYENGLRNIATTSSNYESYYFDIVANF